MSSSLFAHDQVLKEVFAGTGALPAPQPTSDDLGDRHATPEGVRLLRQSPVSPDGAVGTAPFWLANLALVLSGAATVLAALAIALASWSKDSSENSAAQILADRATISEVSDLQQEVQTIADEQSRWRDASRSQNEAMQATENRVSELELGLRRSIEFVDQNVVQTIAHINEGELALKLRLGRLEADRASATAAAPTSARPDFLRSELNAQAAEAAQASFGIVRINGEGGATLATPGGDLSVSVGDIVPSLGKILKIGRLGDNGVVVAKSRTLSAPWSQIAPAQEALRLDIEHDAIDVRAAVQSASVRSGPRKKAAHLRPRLARPAIPDEAPVSN